MAVTVRELEKIRREGLKALKALKDKLWKTCKWQYIWILNKHRISRIDKIINRNKNTKIIKRRI